MEFNQIQTRAKEIREAYRQYNLNKGNAAWDAAAYTQGLVGDVGDLMKLVMAKKNLRSIDNVDQKIAHELSDCLWSIIVIAIELDIDLEKEFLSAMNDIERKVDIK